MTKTVLTLVISAILPFTSAFAGEKYTSVATEELVVQKLKNLKAEQALEAAQSELESRIQSISTQGQIHAGLRLVTLASGLTAAGTFFWGPDHGGKSRIMKKGTKIVFWSSLVLTFVSASAREALGQELTINIQEAIKIRDNLANSKTQILAERNEIEAELMNREK